MNLIIGLFGRVVPALQSQSQLEDRKMKRYSYIC